MYIFKEVESRTYKTIFGLLFMVTILLPLHLSGVVYLQLEETVDPILSEIIENDDQQDGAQSHYEQPVR